MFVYFVLDIVACGSCQDSATHCTVWRQLLTIHYMEVQCSAVKCCAVQWSAVDCSAVQWCEVQCNAEQCSAVQYSTVQYGAVQLSEVQCNPVHLSRVLWIPTQRSAVQLIALQCRAVEYLMTLTSLPHIVGIQQSDNRKKNENWVKPDNSPCMVGGPVQLFHFPNSHWDYCWIQPKSVKVMTTPKYQHNNKITTNPNCIEQAKTPYLGKMFPEHF